MNIDDLKDAWNSNEQNEPYSNLPLNNALSAKTSSATAKLRKNMRNEFIAVVISYIVILFFLFWRQHPPYLFSITYILLFIMLILNCYYFFRFYLFYKSVGNYSFSLKNAIRKVVYELELNIEIYKAYNFCITPMAVIVAFGLICGDKTAASIQYNLSAGHNIQPVVLFIIFANILISFIAVYISIYWHVKLMYGKHLTELKQVMTDLESEV